MEQKCSMFFKVFLMCFKVFQGLSTAFKGCQGVSRYPRVFNWLVFFKVSKVFHDFSSFSGFINISYVLVFQVVRVCNATLLAK